MVACNGVHEVSGSSLGRATIRPTATAVTTFSYVPPAAAKTAEAVFAQTPHPSPTPTVAPTATPRGATVAFRTVEQILTGNCAGCHPPLEGMNLLPGQVYASIVNVPSREVPRLVRVKPGDPAESYLYLKISETRPPVGARMPRSGPPLTNDEITTIQAWIAQGAHD